jgi:hypothetical protein
MTPAAPATLRVGYALTAMIHPSRVGSEFQDIARLAL